MHHRLVRRALAVAAFLLSLPAGAAFHLFSINEAYSNASGTVQYLELTALAGSQQFTTGHTLVTTSGTTRTFTINANLPGDTSGRRMLFGTAGVQAAFGVTPDYIVPNGFLHTAAGTFNWGEGSDVWNHPALPALGGAIDRAGNTIFPTPQNFAGTVGRPTVPPVQLTQVVTGFTQPLDIRFAPGVTNRMFVVEKTGLIRIAIGSAINATPFLNLSGIISTDGERGLLGLAFHPNYATNRAFYVYYTAAGTGTVTIARYLRSTGNPDVADAASGAVLVTQAHGDANNHNGGGLQFGSDGFLYASIGDGGGGGDPFRTGQTPSTRLGKMLRIAVDGGTGYTIPAGNMYPAGGTCATTGCPETFHIGLRNPWRFSVDRLTGEFYIGDVGQGAVEEVDHRAPGAGPTNFGWGVWEGNNCFNDTYFGPAGACAQIASHTRPVITYGHNAAGGNSITGGYVYRGRNIAGLGGYYLYGDFELGNLFAARFDGAAWQVFPYAPLVSTQLSTFGQDAAGEVYLAKIDTGRIYRFDPLSGAPSPDADADNDGVTNGIEGQEGLSYTVKDNDIFQRPRLFAMQQYRDFLGREGDAGGIQFYDNLITSGAADRGAVIESFFNSPEFSGTASPVVRLYFATFLRIPDYPGLQFQVNAYRTGTPLPVIAQNFTASPEFQNTYGSLNNPSYVALLYQNILGRTASQGEIDFHVARLDGGETRGGVLVGFSESPEYRQATANNVYVTMIYVGMLRRAPEQSGFDFWVDYMNNGNSGLALIAGFLNAPEYRNRFLP